MAALVLNLDVEQGASFYQEVQLPSGPDLTGYTGRSQVRNKASETGSPLATPTIAVVDAATRRFSIAMTSLQTTGLPTTGDKYNNKSVFVYDVEFENAGGTVFRACNGTLSVSPEVTK